MATLTLTECRVTDAIFGSIITELPYNAPLNAFAFISFSDLINTNVDFNFYMCESSNFDGSEVLMFTFSAVYSGTQNFFWQGEENQAVPAVYQAQSPIPTFVICEMVASGFTTQYQSAALQLNGSSIQPSQFMSSIF